MELDYIYFEIRSIAEIIHSRQKRCSRLINERREVVPKQRGMICSEHISGWIGWRDLKKPS